MPTEMKDEKKGGEDRVKKAHEEQQKEMENKDVKEPKEYEKPKESDAETPGSKTGV